MEVLRPEGLILKLNVGIVWRFGTSPSNRQFISYCVIFRKHGNLDISLSKFSHKSFHNTSYGVSIHSNLTDLVTGSGTIRTLPILNQSLIVRLLIEALSAGNAPISDG
ncbi:hypothetical protein CJ20_078 [Escherichia phage CJ20]|nr:hypothetical protein CJ20_078 [Escherichia phage CJ20]